MIYYSLKNPTETASFSKAVIKGIAPDRGLYFPKEIPQLEKEFIDSLPTLPLHEMATAVVLPFVEEEMSRADLYTIIQKTFDFDFPIVPITDQIGSLELFHGPTLAFKDVGARFMAQCLGYFNQQEKQQNTTVLVATSGDTGGAVANGFFGVNGIDVVILYPKGKVSQVQEKQLTTLGQNITALEVDGVFDDCQTMVKTAFLDQDITKYRQLTSANSINVARWLPQMLYYFIAYQTHRKNSDQPLVCAVPSGNFGNICAGMMGQQMGLPIDHFIACTNVNDVVPRYLSNQVYAPKPTVPTISNAMDVGDPSNFVRIQKIYGNDFSRLQQHLTGYRFTDEETCDAMQKIFDETSGYIADPHGAIGYLGLKAYLENRPEKKGIFLETAHPIKFPETVEKTLGQKIPIPSRLQDLMQREKKSISIKDYTDLKDFLLR